MKITENGQNVNQIMQVQSAMINETSDVNELSGSASVISNDKVNVSEEAVMRARAYQIVEAVNSSSEVDYDRVNALKQAIADGSYSPDFNKVAEKMIEEDLFFTDL